MDSNRAAVRRDDIDMMGEREILEAKLGRDQAHRDLHVIDIAYGLDDADELHRHHMHDHRVASRPLAASRATVDPAIVLFPARRPGSSFSPRRPATHVEKPPYHSLLPERTRGAEPTREIGRAPSELQSLMRISY